MLKITVFHKRWDSLASFSKLIPTTIHREFITLTLPTINASTLRKWILHRSKQALSACSADSTRCSNIIALPSIGLSDANSKARESSSSTSTKADPKRIAMHGGAPTLPAGSGKLTFLSRTTVLCRHGNRFGPNLVEPEPLWIRCHSGRWNRTRN